MLKNQNWDEAGVISLFKIDERCEMDVILEWLPWGDEAFHGPVNLGEVGGHRAKLKVVLALVKLVKISRFISVDGEIEVP